MGFPRYIKVLVTKCPESASIIIGSALCRCDPDHNYNAHNGQFADIVGVLWNCPIKQMLVQADVMVSKWPEGRVHIRSWKNRNNLS